MKDSIDDEEEFLDACWEEAQTEKALKEVEELEAEFANMPPYEFSKGFDKRMAKAMRMSLFKLRWSRWKRRRKDKKKP